MKRILALVLCVFMAVGLLAACGEKPATSTNPGDSSVDTNLISTEKVTYIDADGESVYSVVRQRDDSDITPIASEVNKQLKSILGIQKTKIIFDGDVEANADAYEILVGNTNRPESQQAIDYLFSTGNGRKGDYIICTIGKKIVINGIGAVAISEAANYFISKYINKDGIEGGINYIYSAKGDYKDITINGVNISKFNFVRDNTSRSWLIQEEIRKAQEYITNTSGFVANLLEDTKTQEGEYEILVGNTNRPGTKQLTDYDEYEILISGKKVYILGGSTYAVQVGVTEFAKILTKNTITDADSKKGSYAATIAGYDSKTYYRHVWGDEFNEATLDLDKKWDTLEEENYYKTGAGYVGGYGKNGPVDMFANDETVGMQDGSLIMRAFYRGEGQGYLHFWGVDSWSSMRYYKGYIEMRARVADGKGIYTGFWLYGTNLPGESPLIKGELEIDIFESLGVPGNQEANVHYFNRYDLSSTGHYTVGSKMGDRKYTLPEGTLFDQYRTIGCLWTDDKIECYYDGQLYAQMETNDFFVNKYLSVRACLNVGWGGRTLPAADIKWPVEMHVDYIRLYQVDGDAIKLY